MRIFLASVELELSDSTRTYGLAPCDVRKGRESRVGRRKFSRDSLPLHASAAVGTSLALDDFACRCDARTDGENDDAPDWVRHFEELEEGCGKEGKIVGFLE